MKIALVLLPGWPRNTPSLSIAYLASQLEASGHDVYRHEFNLRFKEKIWIEFMKKFNKDKKIPDMIIENVDLASSKNYKRLDEYIDYCSSEVLKSKPEILGISLFSDNHNISLYLIHKIRDIDKDVKIMIGGPEVFYNPNRIRQYLSEGLIDYVLLGEGEIVLPNLLDSIENLKPIDLPGMMFRQGKKIINTGDWIPEKDINNFCYPKFEEKDIESSEFPWMLPILSSRGCSEHCDFCRESSFWKYFRQRTPENVVEEIEYQKLRHGINVFRFNDSLLNANPRFLEKICELIVKKKLDIIWLTNVKVSEDLNYEILNIMYESGCRYLFFGIQSASNTVLKEMNKRMDVDVAEKNIKDAHNNGLGVHLYFIVGYPSETKIEFNATLKFIQKNSLFADSIDINVLKLNELCNINDAKLNQNEINKVGKKRLNQIKEIFRDDFIITTNDKTWINMKKKDGIKVDHGLMMRK
ncbi:B12-binding domain-containing radical SAM protein [Candidatus Woesearchaeota archaeon]|nr:B12-binding domain-containing radical SAM protein [Candidatus Woesearchaeota archaeon]